MRWVFLLLTSYFFYMNWEPIYALLIGSSTVITYACAYFMDSLRVDRKRKTLLILCIVLNFGILFLFKYYNFITDSAFDLLTYLGLRVDFPKFSLLLPVGISFYTFQAVGYAVDVYKKRLPHEKHFGKYALFVSFFPQLVAGPIERATSLLPQFHKVIRFDYGRAIDGTKLIIWGYFMKVVVADRLSIYVDSVYNNPEMHSSISLVVATIFFAFQIYCDFGGYSSIAIGCAKILGFDLMTNFRRPYFAQTCGEFWHRWHISLSTWFKDYVYIPMGGSRVSTSRRYLNLMVAFLVSGLWHGANWTFVIWGGLNGLFQVLLIVFKLNAPKSAAKWATGLRILTTFVLINFTWIFFRANSLTDATVIIKRIATQSGSFFIGDNAGFIYSLLGISILLAKDLYDELNLNLPIAEHTYSKYLWYTSLTLMILLFGVFDGSEFIYFQF
ncbi:MBOAT family O-acyltransferase [Neolewinella antarctica]|uniref:D-alanyl-lipoteichoic acid acyltransferase DltB (MBOAT superfamily) n=1 Tax=Neolewinella antarctica TaxID=442734 RepID=A0ABX0X7W0_9BACT|nr:MBOAT family O-acyltransferase [Neolewinella antarctica]NJC24917.1 D-alanyl-lipoteichoic acid acyltransferase DltB (MBOAT superfamily) [Neolewinella antarctica]